MQSFLLFIILGRRRAEERLSAETYVLTSKGEMPGTIYSGEKIQSFACCSAVIKQRFQRMYCMCDFQNSTAVLPTLSSKPVTPKFARSVAILPVIIFQIISSFQIEDFNNFCI